LSIPRLQVIQDHKTQVNIHIPNWIIGIQCLAFIVLYAVWAIPETMSFRNTALITGAVFGLYPIYQFRHSFFQKTAIPIWLLVILFIWAVLHLLLFAQDPAQQKIEFHRIWRYAAIGVIFAVGLGLSLAGAQANNNRWWVLIYLGLCCPVLVYLLKYVLTTYEVQLGIQVPPSLKIYFSSQMHYIPKTDYIAFCLPVLALALGRIKSILLGKELNWKQLLGIAVHFSFITATLFLFYVQDSKNGIMHAAILFLVFGVFLVFVRLSPDHFWRNVLIFLLIVGFFIAALYPYYKKNDSLRYLVADTKIAAQLDRYPEWQRGGEHGLPNNEFGKTVSHTNYVRVAWFLYGSQLAVEEPLGYGLIETSFGTRMKAKGFDIRPHRQSHSGWLDILLAIGFPGFLLVMTSLLFAMRNSKWMQPPYKEIAFWCLLANLLLWCTTEVATIITFPLLLFWIALVGGLGLAVKSQPK
jgi:hypothetical protein